MEHRTIRRTDVQVSLLGFGAAPLANLYRDVAEAQAIETIHAALDQGVTYFDTAPAYGRGLSEQRLGIALAGVPREQTTISTKVGRLLHEDGTIEWDFSRDGVLRTFEGSLERLQRDSVDILHIHDPDNHYTEAITGAYPALDELRSQGVIKAVSVGINRWPLLVDFMRDGDFDCFMLAGRYTLLEQGALPLLDQCAEKGIGILAAGVYNSGILATGAKEGAKYNYRDAAPRDAGKDPKVGSRLQAVWCSVADSGASIPLGTSGDLLVGYRLQLAGAHRQQSGRTGDRNSVRAMADPR